MARPGLQRVVIDDFSPGIYDDWLSSGGARSGAPLGAAQMTGTAGCLSARGGGLIPGPARVNRIQQGLIDASGSYPASEGDKMYVCAMRVLSPVYDRSASATTEAGKQNPFPDNLFFGFEWYYGTGPSSYRHKQRARLYKMSLQSAANPTLGSVGTYDAVTQQTAASFGTPFGYGWSSIDLSRELYAGPTTPGIAIAAISQVSNRDVLQNAHVTYPDSNAPTTDSTKSMTGLDGFGGYSAYAVFGHQDRVNCLHRSVNYNVGPNMEVPTDIMLGTEVNDVTTLGYGLENFVAENPGLMGAWCTINASEAFFVKQQRGGFVLRGDVSYPTVVRLPSLPPTFDACNIACVAPNGMVVYGSRTGVYGWGGGDTAVELSKQLDGYFWEVAGTENFRHVKGSFTAHDGYVAAPNNFLLDTESGGWWRLPTTVPYAFYDTSAAGYLIGAPAFVSDSQTVLADYYDFQQGQTSFTWKSQPLKVTQNRTVDFRECALTAQGTGTVTITVTGIDGNTSSASFTLDDDNRPVTITKGLGVHTYDAVVSISSDSGSSDPAPRIYRVDLGFNARETASG